MLPQSQDWVVWLVCLLSSCQRPTHSKPHMKQYFPCATTKPRLGLPASLAVSMPRSLVLPPSQDWVRCSATSYERIVPLCFHQAKEGSSAWWFGCLHAEVPSTSTKPRLGEVLGRLVVTMPRSNRRRCCRPRLNQLFGGLAVSLPRSNRWPSTSTLLVKQDWVISVGLRCNLSAERTERGTGLQILPFHRSSSFKFYFFPINQA